MGTAVQWALVGASTIAEEWMINAIRAQPDGAIGAIVSSALARAWQFADKHSTPQASAELKHGGIARWKNPETSQIPPDATGCRRVNSDQRE
ncbi:hypothetical protein [Paraburkholderia sp. HD33-4]|uniref:hypothetical protein n=1 Tax=Paraburkholderia sp. HD33-4 TaxID=2883242 RepID=UPI001F314A6D|nr:hypothetical protein [Paraburkholderia sp. HD33-4]